MKNLFFCAVALLMLASCGKPISAAFVATGKTEAPAKIAFQNQSKNAERFEWDFGDGSTSQDSCPSHQYAKPGDYTVALKAYRGKKKTASFETKMEIKAPLECYVEIETDFGNMLVLLYNSTPQHRDNFIKLAEQGYFDDLLFHRVISGFMIQGGDPNSRNASASASLGSGGPDYTVPAEFVDSLVHVKGALCAARTNNPEKRSSGSQFYLVQGKAVPEAQLAQIESQKGFRYTKAQRDAYATVGGVPFLDRDYTVFGQVVKGLEVIDAIAAVQTAPGDRPKKDVKMKIKVVR